MDESRALQRSEAVLWRQALRGLLLLPPEADEPLLVTAPGDVIWAALAEPCTLGELVEALADAYEEDPERIRADIAPVLETLLDCGAIVDVDVEVDG